MDATNAKIAELEQLLWRLRDQTIDADGVARIESLVLGDADVRKFYIRYSMLCGGLRWMNSELNDSTPPPVESLTSCCAPIVIQTYPDGAAPLPGGSFSFGGFLFAYCLAAIVVGIALLVGWECHVSVYPRQVADDANRASRPASETAPTADLVFVGRVTGMKDCRWSDPATEPFNGASVPLGRRYALAAGLMEITYDNGARVVLQGPCSYQVESSTSGFLSVGRLTAQLEKTASVGDLESARRDGSTAKFAANLRPSSLPVAKSPPLPLSPSSSFAVRTPTAIVTDLGTEFGVEVNAQGHTTSHVFRGSVRVQSLAIDGKPQGAGAILRANESARVQNRGAGGIALLPSSTKPVDFVRKLPKRTIRVFDLVDVVAGGNGFSDRRGRGIAPFSGQVVYAPSHKTYASDGKFHRVAGLPFVDGVFVPKGRNAPVQLDSAGHTFAGFNNSEGRSGGVLWADQRVRISPPLPPPHGDILYIPTILGGVDYSRPPHGVLFLHSNMGITFDLQAIRQTAQGAKLLRFRAMTANTEVHSRLQGSQNTADLWVFLDGREQFCRKGINASSGAVPVTVPIGERNRYLTLVSTDGGNGISGDWILFGDPQLEIARDAVASPDLMPNPSQPSPPNGEEAPLK